MAHRWTRWTLPAALVALCWSPAPAQIRLGVDLGAVHIRIAPDAPPPMRVETRPRRPGRNVVWIGGAWDRHEDRWAWTPGRWEVPARRGSIWVRSQYRREGRAYRYEPGHWSHQRLEPGEDYTRWQKEHGRRRGNPDRNERGRGPGGDHRDE